MKNMVASWILAATWLILGISWLLRADYVWAAYHLALALLWAGLSIRRTLRYRYPSRYSDPNVDAGLTVLHI